MIRQNGHGPYLKFTFTSWIPSTVSPADPIPTMLQTVALHPTTNNKSIENHWSCQANYPWIINTNGPTLHRSKGWTDSHKGGTHQPNKHSLPTKFQFNVGDWVLLSTLHWWWDYKSSNTHRAAKFMPHYNRPYHIIATDDSHSTVTLNLLTHTNIFSIFHTSKVWLFISNNDTLFHDHSLTPPYPVTNDGQREFFIDKIIKQCQLGCGLQYLVQWHGEGPEGDKCLPSRELEDCKVLNKWQQKQNASATTSPGSSSTTAFHKMFLLPPCHVWHHSDWQISRMTCFGVSGCLLYGYDYNSKWLLVMDTHRSPALVLPRFDVWLNLYDYGLSCSLGTCFMF
jgi:hypothetical protein